MTHATTDPDGWTVSTQASEAGWQVEARWWGRHGEPPTDGPRELVIRQAADVTPAQRQKGITTGVMRRLERHVTAMAEGVRAHRDLPSVGAYQRMARTYVERRASELPPSPRGPHGTAYYDGLLDIMEDLVERGYPEPVNLLSTVLQLPKGTVKTRLNTARHRRAAHRGTT